MIRNACLLVATAAFCLLAWSVDDFTKAIDTNTQAVKALSACAVNLSDLIPR